MREINLVPDVKIESIRMQKVRNLVIFVCLLVAAGCAALLIILGSIKGGQDIAMSNQDSRMKLMSDKIGEYDGLAEFLTIQNQLGKLAEVSENKKVLSRVFNVMSALVPKGPDTVRISEMAVTLDNGTIVLEAQADAGEDPLIDYRVLESFKKTVGLSKYDYGRYVDKEGNIIPTRCIVERNTDGSMFNENGQIYALWTKSRKGCDPSVTEEDEEKGSGSSSVNNGPVKLNLSFEDGELSEGSLTTPEGAAAQAEEEVAEAAADAEENDAVTVEEAVQTGVRIWRTPQFDEWYKKEYITLDGEISGVEHFASQCIKYSGGENGDSVKWTDENECELSAADMLVTESSNGRDSDDNLVLRFSATITLDSEVLKFQNKHMMAIGPTSQNVTDSYVQIGRMFAERAADCAAGDTACINDTRNRGEE